ncbi:phosphonate metabolism transcriptional regulator PhnF [Polymorphum gilvum]|uniref:Phosphonates metabolism transcriptional regulator PhnF n=1 Tax=Polymorphum gilvum (strain LMG 25793 / CGMCC 1.9160 / SL003B-26A1) TaxID=991905 RepID=F2J2Z4_POLGS|nr:phosphonate metabolism transcriptional regulator PhnF [Polymorphum gilvum]ADZ68864.1 Phosphonates metabolism transcriptional regulator PhnF [Polymorphum gilvum SL003B-26A1]
MTKRVNIDRGAGIAIWRQIAEWLRAEVGAGHFEPGSRLPTEAEIAARFGVNRHTVRRAIAALAADGLLRADQGRGTFVAAAPISYPISARTRFSDIVANQARAPSGRLIGSGTEEADALLAAWLDVPVGTLLLRIETLRVADGVPILVGTSWFEQARFPSLVKDYAETGSFTAALERAGLADYRRKETRIAAELVDAEDARLLEVAAGQPVLVVESVNLDPDGRPVQYTRGRVAADRVQLVVEN